MMHRTLVALWSICLVDYVHGFNPLPSAPIHQAPKTVPNGVARPMPGRGPSFYPTSPGGIPGASSFVPPAPRYSDPALSAMPSASQEAVDKVWAEPWMPESTEGIRSAENTERAAAMQAEGGGFTSGFGAGIFASLHFIFAAVLLSLKSRIERRSSNNPLLPEAEGDVFNASPEVSRAHQGQLVANFTPTPADSPFSGALSSGELFTTTEVHGMQRGGQLVAKMSSTGAPVEAEKPKSNLLLLAFYFLGWYALNVGYNIANKQVLNVFPCAFTVALCQLLMAWVWLLPQWATGIRPVPKPSEGNMKALQKVSLLHGFGHLITVLSLGLGSVSFVNVVKAAEPVFAAALSFIFAGSVLAFPVYLSLLPVCAGVAIAAAGELSFTWACFGAAMMSNLLFASRAVFSKMAMTGDDQGENMDSANTFAVVHLLATAVCLPVALIMEGSKVPALWAAASVAPGWTQAKLAGTLALSGFYLYTYNEFAFKVLGMVSPVAQAVGNTIKRVVILVASAIAFATPMTPVGILGSSIAMVGVLVYSLVDQRYAKKKIEPAQ